MNLASKVVAFECDSLGDKETLELFSELVRTNMAWTLQGRYGKTAKALIDNGVLTKDGTIMDF